MIPQRILDKVEQVGDCRIWTGYCQPKGYGRVRFQGRKELVHRVFWVEVHGPVPVGLQLDHLCRNRACCNPDHLELVTPAENIRRGLTGKVNNGNARKTHCAQGHPFVPDNTYYWQGHRVCATCKRAQVARAKARARAQ